MLAVYISEKKTFFLIQHPLFHKCINPTREKKQTTQNPIIIPPPLPSKTALIPL